jgi:hypothetical protein
LWRGNNPEKNIGNLAAWPMVQKPKSKGGLGIINLRLQNDALLLKQLHKFYNHQDIPWINLIWQRYYVSKVPHASSEIGSFWWKDVLRLHDLYRGIAKCAMGNGATVTFWEDLWLDEVLFQKFPRFFSFVRNENLSVQQVPMAEDLDSIFHLPISSEAFQELEQLQVMLSNTPYHPKDLALWILAWGSTNYSSRRYYQMVFVNLHVHPVFKSVWISKCIPRIKFFIWLVLIDRLNTRLMLTRRNYHVEPNVFLCLVSSR